MTRRHGGGWTDRPRALFIVALDAADAAATRVLGCGNGLCALPGTYGRSGTVKMSPAPGRRSALRTMMRVDPDCIGLFCFVECAQHGHAQQCPAGVRMSKRQHDDDPLASVAALERFGRETKLAANQIWSPFTPAIRHIVTMLSNKHSKSDAKRDMFRDQVYNPWLTAPAFSVLNARVAETPMTTADYCARLF